MTASQNTAQLKRQNWLNGLLAAALTALLVAVMAVAINARPVAAPTTAPAKPDVYLPSLHDQHLAAKPDVYLPSLHDRHLTVPPFTTPAFHDRHRTTWKAGESTYIPSLLKPQIETRVPAPPYPDQVRHPGGPFRAQ